MSVKRKVLGEYLHGVEGMKTGGTGLQHVRTMGPEGFAPLHGHRIGGLVRHYIRGNDMRIPLWCNRRADVQCERVQTSGEIRREPVLVFTTQTGLQYVCT